MGLHGVLTGLGLVTTLGEPRKNEYSPLDAACRSSEVILGRDFLQH